MTATAVYCRISMDRTGEGAGVERQERACRDLVTQRGWDVSEVFVDNDVSATTGVARPEYQRMLDAVQAGEVDAVVAWKLDRLTRTPRQIEDWIDLADRTGVAVVTVDGRLDLTTPVGQFHARTLASVARLEVQTAAERRRAANYQRALRGEPTRTGPRPFGWLPDRTTLDPDEADKVRAAVDAALGRTSDSLTSLVHEWNTAGLPTSQGNAWSVTNLRRVLENPRLAGLTVYQGEVLHDPDTGQPVPGQWEPIITVEEHQRLLATFAARRRSGKVKRGRPPTSLLSGIAVCGLCDTPMQAMRSRGDRYYHCSTHSGRRPEACRSVSIRREHLDQFVVAAVMDLLATPAMAEAMAQRAAATAAARAEGAGAGPNPADLIAEHRAALSDLDHARFVERSIDASRHRAMVDTLTTEIAQAEEALAQAAETPALAGMGLGDAPSVREAWEAADVARRREVLRAVLDAVVIGEYRDRGTPGLDPERVTLVLADALDAAA